MWDKQRCSLFPLCVPVCVSVHMWDPILFPASNLRCCDWVALEKQRMMVTILLPLPQSVDINKWVLLQVSRWKAVLHNFWCTLDLPKPALVHGLDLERTLFISACLSQWSTEWINKTVERETYTWGMEMGLGYGVPALCPLCVWHLSF